MSGVYESSELGHDVLDFDGEVRLLEVAVDRPRMFLELLESCFSLGPFTAEKLNEIS